MIISMIMGTASMMSALPIGAAVRSIGAPRTASRRTRHASAARYAAPGADRAPVIVGEIASLIVGLHRHDEPRPTGSTSRATFLSDPRRFAKPQTNHPGDRSAFDRTDRD